MENLYENTQILKQKYNDYIEIYNFFNSIETHLYGSRQKFQLGFGFCNETKSSFQPLFKDIANCLINDDFKLNFDELKKTYKTLYFSNNINRFIKYLEERPYKKYYYYQTIKNIMFGKNLFTPEQKIEYIKEYYNNHPLSKIYDISINSEGGFINVKLIEK